MDKVTDKRGTYGKVNFLAAKGGRQVPINFDAYDDWFINDILIDKDRLGYNDSITLKVRNYRTNESISVAIRSSSVFSTIAENMVKWYPRATYWPRGL